MSLLPTLHQGSGALPSSRESRKRPIVISVGIVVIVAVFAGGWFAAQAFVSPQQRAAVAAAPPPGPVTASVTRGVLSQSISARAEIEQNSQMSVHLTPAAALAVVTKRPLGSGDVVQSGEVLLEVNGRPVIALKGGFPYYRGLESGMSGPDISQLQKSLSRLGFTVTATGIFDAPTGVALGALYKKLGYASPEGIPLSEMVVIPSASAQVVSIPSVGAVVASDTVLSLSSGALIARAEIAASLAEALEKGMKCQLTAADGTAVAAKIASVESPAVDGENAIVIIESNEEAFPAEWASTQAVALIELRKVAEDALTLPSAAIVNAGEGNASVLKQQPDGSFLSLRVREIGELQGMSAVEVVGDKLAEGDLVKVG